MAKKKSVKTNLLDHSEAKVRLLGEYLKRFLAVLSNLGYTERIRVYDLFCSEGIYDNGGEGSPLVILRAIKNLHESGVIRGKIPPIDCYFNDIDPEKIEKLKRVIAEKSLHQDSFGKLEFSNNDYIDEVRKLPQVLKGIPKQKIFVFIDPYDYKHIKASDIRDLLQYKNAEVLLWQPTQFMYRFEQNGTPKALKDFIEQLVPYEKWKDSDSVWDFIEQLKAEFRKYLGDDYFVDTFTLQKDTRTVFCLIFFSSHIRGFEKMLEAKWDLDEEEGKGWEYSGQRDLFSAAFKTNVLEEKLRDFLKVERSNGEIHSFTLHAGFLPKHAVEILTNSQEVGQLSVTATDGQPARKKAFYISYDNYRDDFNKVKIKLK